MPTTQRRAPASLGFLGTSSLGSTFLNLNAAATWLAFSFVPSEGKTLSKVKLYASAVTGTLGASDLTCDLYSSAAGAPNASVESRATVTRTPLSTDVSGAWVEWTGFTTALTAGVQYWLVFKNANGTPASNLPAYRWGISGTNSFPGTGSLATFGWNKKHTTTSGGSWVTALTGVVGPRVEYSDGSFDGVPVSNIATPLNLVYSTREYGVRITTPANATLNVRGIVLPIGVTGTPTGSLRFHLYTGSTPSLLATTNSIALSDVSSGGMVAAYLPATQAVSPGTILRLTLSETTQSDTSTNAYRATNAEFTVDNDANSKALLPYGLQNTYFDGSTWTDTDTLFSPFALILDTDAEFAAAAGSIAVETHCPVTIAPYRVTAY